MKKFAIFSFVSLICMSGLAQEKQRESIIGFKCNYLTTIFSNSKQSSPYYYSELYNSSQFLKPTISFFWQKSKSNSHEIELTHFQINKIEKGAYQNLGPLVDPMPVLNISKTHISIRYEYIFKFIKSDKKWHPELGLGINPYFIQIKEIPQSTIHFNKTNSYYGARLNLIPRLIYFINQKVFLDLNIPFNLYDFNYHSKQIRNPSVEIKNQTQTNFEDTFLPKVLNFRVGLGIKI